MENIEKIIIDCYAKILKDSGLNFEPSLNNKIGTEYGLDSLGLVNLIFEIEESLNLTLDSVLIKIRGSNNLQEVATIIANEFNLN